MFAEKIPTFFQRLRLALSHKIMRYGVKAPLRSAQNRAMRGVKAQHFWLGSVQIHAMRGVKAQRTMDLLQNC